MLIRPWTNPISFVQYWKTTDEFWYSKLCYSVVTSINRENGLMPLRNDSPAWWAVYNRAKGRYVR